MLSSVDVPSMIITIVFVIAFYKMNVDLDRDIFKQYDYMRNQNGK